ncbi:expressed unknown protein [Seminavis robusta]|uniref:PTM/DIR17-like Tudor domain-containing protein n=1 Tax=Seminavis robusta TaxID=568900 RepID=A0A9N8H8H3_9STRA|nr:expressed unknown protein [Seminavis robusta]|eukprot:Sro91_g047880.1 n/a (420) ;mRNA; f:110405-111755
MSLNVDTAMEGPIGLSSLEERWNNASFDELWDFENDAEFDAGSLFLANPTALSESAAVNAEASEATTVAKDHVTKETTAPTTKNNTGKEEKREDSVATPEATGSSTTAKQIIPNKMDAVFGRGRKREHVRNGSLYRALIEKHYVPYSQLDKKNFARRRRYVQQNILDIILKNKGRFIMRQGCAPLGSLEMRLLDPTDKKDTRLIFKKVQRSLFNEKKRRQAKGEDVDAASALLESTGDDASESTVHSTKDEFEDAPPPDEVPTEETTEEKEPIQGEGLAGDIQPHSFGNTSFDAPTCERENGNADGDTTNLEPQVQEQSHDHIETHGGQYGNSVDLSPSKKQEPSAQAAVVAEATIVSKPTAKYPPGTKVHKEFPPFGWYSGQVVSFDGQTYKVVYEDDDSEYLNETDLDIIIAASSTG